MRPRRWQAKRYLNEIVYHELGRDDADHMKEPGAGAGEESQRTAFLPDVRNDSVEVLALTIFTLVSLC